MNKTLTKLTLALLVLPLVFLTSGVLKTQVAHADVTDITSPLNPTNPLNPASPLNPTNPLNPASPLNPNNYSTREDINKETPRLSTKEQYVITLVIIGFFLVLIFIGLILALSP